MNYLFDAMHRAAGKEPPKHEDRPAPQPVPVPVQASAAAVAVEPSAHVPVREKAPEPIRIHSFHPAHVVSLGENVAKIVGTMGGQQLQRNIAALEQLKVIRTRLVHLCKSRKVKAFMVTSPMAGEGKTFISNNLAFVLSQLNHRVLLIDADLRKPTVSKILGFSPQYGLGDFLEGKKSISELCWQVSPTLTVIPSLALDGDTAEMLHRPVMRELLERARQEFDFVVVDTPPVFPIADGQVLMNVIDGVLLVVRAGLTSYELLAEATEVLGSKIFGTILNDAAETGNGTYYQYAYGGKNA